MARKFSEEKIAYDRQNSSCSMSGEVIRLPPVGHITHINKRGMTPDTMSLINTTGPDPLTSHSIDGSYGAKRYHTSMIHA